MPLLRLTGSPASTHLEVGPTAPNESYITVGLPLPLLEGSAQIGVDRPRPHAHSMVMAQNAVAERVLATGSTEGYRLKGKRRELGGLESEVLAALWSAGAPLTVNDVVSALGSDLALNTVHTTLVRLHAKGAVVRNLVGRAHVYSAVMDNADLAARKMRGVLDQGTDSVSVLRSFVGTLTPAEEAALTELLSRSRETES